MPTFKRLYYATTFATAILCAALWYGRELTFWLYGFDRSLITLATADAFRAYAATANARSGLLWAATVADIALLTLSLRAMTRRVQGKREIPLGVAVGTVAVSVLAALVLLSVQLAPSPTTLGFVGR